MPARIASAPPSRCSGPGRQQQRARAERERAAPRDRAAAFGLACQRRGAEVGGQRGIAGRIVRRVVAAEANGDHRLVGCARRQAGIAFGRARGARAGGDDGVRAEAAERDQRMRGRFVTEQKRAQQLRLRRRQRRPQAAGRQHEQADGGGGRGQRGGRRFTPADRDFGRDQLVVGERAHGRRQQRGGFGAAFGRARPAPAAARRSSGARPSNSVSSWVRPPTAAVTVRSRRARPGTRAATSALASVSTVVRCPMAAERAAQPAAPSGATPSPSGATASAISRKSRPATMYIARSGATATRSRRARPLPRGTHSPRGTS